MRDWHGIQYVHANNKLVEKFGDTPILLSFYQVARHKFLTQLLSAPVPSLRDRILDLNMAYIPSSDEKRFTS